MDYVTINAKTDPKLKAAASELADQLGISISVVINTALRNFVAERKLVISEDYTPNEFLKKRIAQSETDLKNNRTTTVKSTNELSDLIDSL